MTYSQKLISLLEDHMTKDFYVGENIPKHKLENAVEYFPIEKEVTIYGLIDSTVMGSNKLGLAITNYGLIWGNDWTITSTKSRLSWDELLSRKSKLAFEEYSITFGNDIRFGMAGSQMGRKDVLNLLLDLTNLLSDIGNDLSYGYKNEINNAKHKAINSSPNKLTSPQSTSNTKSIGSDYKIYETALILSLALMTLADGQIDDDEIELVSLFIEEEESINDNDNALSLYGEHIEKLENSRSKSNAMYKLQSAKMITLIRKLKNKEDIGKLEIMLEGMAEAAGGSSNTATIDMMKRILGNF